VVGKLFFLFLIRAIIAGCFLGLYVYTTEFYPTILRSTGLGFASTIARFGGILTPFVAQVLTGSSVPLALSIYAIVILLAAFCTIRLRIETLGSKMYQNLKEMEKPDDESNAKPGLPRELSEFS